MSSDSARRRKTSAEFDALSVLWRFLFCKCIAARVVRVLER